MDFFEIIGSLLVSKLLWLVVAALAALYYYLTLQHDFFEKRGVKFIKPLPLFGNMFKIVFRQKNINDLNIDFYTTFPNEKYVCIFCVI